MIAAALLFLKGLSWQTWLVVVIGTGAVGIYAEKTGRIDLLEHELAGMTKERDGLQASITAAQQLGVKTDAANRAREKQTAADQKEIADESQRFSIRARDDSSSASTALQQLLSRAAAASRGGQASSNPGAASGGTADEGAGLRADVLGGVGDEAVRYARIADEARIRGGQCASDYDAVAKPIESERGDDDPP